MVKSGRLGAALITMVWAAAGAAPPTPAPTKPVPTIPAAIDHCLPSGDGYFRAHLAGALDAHIDWSDRGTRCEGESRDHPPGVRLSFQRPGTGDSNLLFVFGLTGVRQGHTAKEIGANLTVIVQGTDRIYGTRGDTRCTIDSLNQRTLGPSTAYRVEARGFCTQPAHAVRGEDTLLVSTFEFAGLVNYDPPLDQNPGNLIPKQMTPVK